MSYPGTPGLALVVRHTGQVFPLAESRVSIGRHIQNSIVLADPQVSRYHAEIMWQNGSYFVRDVDSSNGTFVNEVQLSGPQLLRPGDVLRTGSTVFDVRGSLPAAQVMESVTLPPQEAPAPRVPRRPAVPVILGVLLGGFMIVCLTTAGILYWMDQRRGNPSVTIRTPAEGLQVIVGQEIRLEASATGASNIIRLDLSVDGSVVASSPSADAAGQSSLAVAQSYTFTSAGTHTVMATAYTARGSARSASRRVTVVEQTGRVTPGPTAATITPTVLASETPTPSETPTVTPSATPSDTPGPTETAAPPTIAFFRAASSTVNAGECTMLEWGQVSGAIAATIDHGIGGIATPGSVQVCPMVTTTYVMTAAGPGGVAKASATVTVQLVRPDLLVESIVFSPVPPVKGHDTLVRIEIRNAGNASAGPFAWEWQPGSADPISGSVPEGLGAGALTVVSLTWRPATPYTELVTVARVDTGNAVAESDETNNELQRTIQVVPPAPTTVTLGSEAGLDGYVIAGQSAFPSDEIRVGNISTTGLGLIRGFMSFDLLQIPSGATIESVRLRFFQASIVGDPYPKLGGLLLNHVDYGPSLDVGDFGAPVLDSISLGSEPAAGVWYTVSAPVLSSWVAQDRSAGRSWFQVGLQFAAESDGDEQADYIRLESGDNSLGTGNMPELIVTYTMP